jgi:hypothetical protein
MKKKKIISKLAAFIRKKQSILPFKQSPPIKGLGVEQKKEEMNETDLFSHFTANIIKEQVIFTR